MENIDVSLYSLDNNILAGSKFFIVVKSQNQVERRKRMLESQKRKRFGRFTPSKTERGLLVCGMLKDGKFNIEWSKEFREPRHIKRLSNGSFLLTEINRVLRIDSTGCIIRAYTHPFFGYLHSVEVTLKEDRALIVSSGYDAVIEIDLISGEETFSWFAWDNGFNPDADGTWLAVTQEKYESYLNEGKKAILINPVEYGEQGITTALRMAHPNVAVYENSKVRQFFLVCVGHNGELCRVSFSDGKIKTVYSDLCVMPHGLSPRQTGGWMITQTTIGKWIWLDQKFQDEFCFDLSNLEGKVPGTEDAEWIQQVVSIDQSKALGIDGNRGLIALDYKEKKYCIYQVDPNWCIQDALLLE